MSDLDDLRERMVHAEELLHNLAAHTMHDGERRRREAKAEGVRLCLGYLDELMEAS